MDTLSVEMFEAIFGYITEPADLLSLRAVNRLFHARFTPPAFQVMRFRRTTQNNIRLRKLVSTGLARWVTDVTFDVNMSGELVLCSLAEDRAHCPPCPDQPHDEQQLGSIIWLRHPHC